MNVGSVNWNWREVEALLESLAASDDELIVCGGQAVAFWSQRYGLTPITSRDLDVVADRESAKRMADRLGGTASYPGRYDMTVLTAVVRVAWFGKSLQIECLSTVPGLEPDPEAISEKLVLGATRHLRILHPMALVMAKLHALRFFDQTERQDESHFRVAWIAAQRWLIDLVESDSPHGLRLIHQWYRTARQRPNRRILDSLMLDWKALIPLEALHQRQTLDPLIARFLAEQWPRLAQE
ncbi:MAG: hypothetical protein IT581_21200 [Verrucomicrobiales bacterium]|nr:hypothetical protein [Verrucomicrobiales bacterium]